MSKTRTNVNEYHVGNEVLAGWTYQDDGEWYATLADDSRTTIGPVKGEGHAQSEIAKRASSHAGRFGTWVILVADDSHPMYDDAAGSVTFIVGDKSESVTWTVRDGKANLNGWSGVGTPAEAEAKAYAINIAADEAHRALKALEAVAA